MRVRVILYISLESVRLIIQTPCLPIFIIFTASKQSWVVLSPDIPAVKKYYERTEYWSKESLERRSALHTKNTEK